VCFSNSIVRSLPFLVPCIVLIFELTASLLAVYFFRVVFIALYISKFLNTR